MSERSQEMPIPEPLAKPFAPLRIFLSYAHDEHAALAERLASDLKAHGHEVWYDPERLLPASDWELRIEQGLEWATAEPGQ